MKRYNPTKSPRHLNKMKRYAELIRNYESYRIKSLQDNNLIIDPDYRGVLLVPIYNDSERVQYITTGDRIAQMVVQPFCTCEFEEATELSSTERGKGAFGSTGKDKVVKKQ